MDQSENLAKGMCPTYMEGKKESPGKIMRSHIWVPLLTPALLRLHFFILVFMFSYEAKDIFAYYAKSLLNFPLTLCLV